MTSNDLEDGLGEGARPAMDPDVTADRNPEASPAGPLMVTSNCLKRNDSSMTSSSWLRLGGIQVSRELKPLCTGSRARRRSPRVRGDQRLRKSKPGKSKPDKVGAQGTTQTKSKQETSQQGTPARLNTVLGTAKSKEIRLDGLGSKCYPPQKVYTHTKLLSSRGVSHMLEINLI